MAQSIVQICNAALSLIGETQITNATLSDATEAERQCNLLYDLSKEYLLRAHPWNFAETRATLARITETPPFEFSYYYQIPSDCLRILHTINTNEEVNPEDYKIEGARRIATDATTLNIIYIKNETDPTQFDTLFVQALIYHLGAHLAMVLSDNRTLSDSLMEKFDMYMKQAKMIDGQEGMPRRRTRKNDWLSFRSSWRTR